MSAAGYTVFYDNKKDMPALKERYPEAEHIFVRGLPEADALAARRGRTLVLALHNDKLQSAAALCRALPFAAVFVLPGGAPNAEEPIPIDVSKPRLDYMETEITRVCNLNCRGCADFINIACGEERYYALERFRADLTRMKELFWGIGKIRLMGGEPLLNPDLASYAEAAREIFPDCDLRIVTNGLLLPRLSPETLSRIKKAGGGFDISDYPPTHKMKKELAALLREAGVDCNFSVPMRFFFRTLLGAPADDPAPAFRNCIFTHCHMMGDGRLAPCSYAFCAYRFNRRFGSVFPEDDGFDLSDPALDGWDIIKAFGRPHDFCRCCARGAVPFRWEGHRAAADARESDWLVRETWLNTRFVPRVQSMVKNAAAAMRRNLQSRKK